VTGRFAPEGDARRHMGLPRPQPTEIAANPSVGFSEAGVVPLAWEKALGAVASALAVSL
jgi:hypothetical protein